MTSLLCECKSFATTILAATILCFTGSFASAQSARMSNGDWQPGVVLVYQNGGFELATRNKVAGEANTYVLIHGAHTGAETQKEFVTLAKALSARDPSANILFVDWAYWSKLNLEKVEEIVKEQLGWTGATVAGLGIIDLLDELFGDGTAITSEHYAAGVAVNVAVGAGRVFANIIPAEQTEHIPDVAERVYNILFTSDQSWYWTTNGQKSQDFESLGLDPTRTHIIGHSHGAHVGGLICKRVLKNQGVRVKRLSALDPSTSAVHISAENAGGKGWDRNVAEFVDTYRTSEACCDNKAYGDYNYFIYDSSHPLRQASFEKKLENTSNPLGMLVDVVKYDIGLHTKAIEVFTYMVGRGSFLEATSFADLDKGRHNGSKGQWIRTTIK